VPGLTFGWSPKGVGLIAFADTSGKLSLMDRTGAVRRIDSTKAVTLPAWSMDGTKLAYLEKTARTTYALVIATVGR
jgi:Tol biopolymer transport system component